MTFNAYRNMTEDYINQTIELLNSDDFYRYDRETEQPRILIQGAKNYARDAREESDCRTEQRELNWIIDHLTDALQTIDGIERYTPGEMTTEDIEEILMMLESAEDRMSNI